MILVNQYFKECHFCERKIPPRWSPIERNGHIYCSDRCIHFEAKFPEVTPRTMADKSAGAR